METRTAFSASARQDAQAPDMIYLVKSAIEDKDLAALESLFARQNQICISGHFVSLEEFITRLKQMLARIEQVSVDITRVEEQEVLENRAFYSYRVDFAWIDAGVWEDRAARGILSLTVIRAAMQAKGRARAAQQQGPWEISGFSYSAERALDGGTGDGGQFGATGEPSGFQDLGRTYGLWF